MVESKKAEIKNVYLFAVYCTDLFLSDKKKVNGGGQMKKILMENKEFIEKNLVIKDDENEDKIDMDIE